VSIGANLEGMKTPVDFPRSRPGRLPALAAAGLVFVALAGAAIAGEAKPADPNAPKDGQASKAAAPAEKVFTNKDLEKYRASRSATRTIVVDVNALQKPGQAEGEAVPDDAVYPDEKARRIADLEASIQESTARLAAIDQQMAFFANPFLPPPQLSPDEVKAQEGLSRKDAYQRLEAEKAQLAEKLSAQKADLDKTIALPTRPRSLPAATNPAADPQPQP